MKSRFLIVFLLTIACSAMAADSTLAATPPMGWNSWNHFACKVSADDVRAAADAIAANGMKAAGYLYVNIDDCWQGDRDEQGRIRPKTCAKYEGSYGHEGQDAQQYADWGFDYLKYDWCSAERAYKRSEMPAVYQKMHDALVRTGRPIVFSLCQYGYDRVWRWGASVGGNLWRTTEDINDHYDRMS